MDPQHLVQMMSRMGLTPADLAGMMSRFDADASTNGPGSMGDLLRGISAPRRSGATAPRNGPPSLSFDSSAEEVEAYKAWFVEDFKKPPELGPVVPRGTLLAINEKQRRKQEAEERALDDSQIRTRLTIIGFPKHSCMVPLRGLKPIKCSEMLMRKSHKGFYLLCRPIAPWTSIVAIQTIVEDVDGNARLLLIYNFPTTHQARLNYINELFPLGVTMAILEPTYKAATQGPNAIIRVDSPTDIVFLDSNHELLRGVQWKTGTHVSSFNGWPSNADRWRALGNDHFKAGRWLPSAFAYSYGLRCDPASLVLRLNRSESYLRLKFYTAASADARYVRSAIGVTDAHRGKALYREAKAEYARGNYQTARDLFKQWHESHTDDGESADWIDRCGKRLREGQTGVYDWTQLFKQSQSNLQLDVADYKGPVEVKQVSNRGGGRGMVGIRDLTAGELLVVEKPFSYASSNTEKPSVIITAVNLLTSRMNQSTQCENIANAAQVLYGNSDLYDRVFHLYAGPDYPSPPPIYPPKPVLDPVELDPLSPTQCIDIAKLESVCTHNDFSLVPLQPNDPYTRPSHPDSDTGTALYTLTSMFNHSCSPNASHCFIGNVMAIRASCTIKAGEEITIAYVSPMQPYSKRCDTLSRAWKITGACDCAQCQDDRADGDLNIRRREEILAALPSRLLTKPLNELQALEKKVSATYAPTRGPRRPAMFNIHHCIAEYLRTSSSEACIKRAIQEDMKALECLGFTILKDDLSRRASKVKKRGDAGLMVEAGHLGYAAEEAVAPMLRIAQTYILVNDLTNLLGWLRTAQWVFNTSMGGGKELFMLVEGPKLKAFDLLDVATTML